MRTLFVGKGTGSPVHYRIRLPAEALGHDWTAVSGAPPKLKWLSGNPDSMHDYETVVLQQPAGRAWLSEIERLREYGVRVLFEIDDYLHGVSKVRKHNFAKHFPQDLLTEMERCMEACDGLIVTTDFLAKRYKKFARDGQVFVCPNGIDLDRFSLPKSINANLKPRDPDGMRTSNKTVMVGWSGGTGHVEPLEVWLSHRSSSPKCSIRCRRPLQVSTASR